MQDRYEPENFESKWRERWLKAELFKTREEKDRPKFYGLDFFPYPSGAGLSVGHCRNYIPTDVVCRMKYMQGYNVLHPMGFDAFGLPAENEAIKKQRNPSEMVQEYGATYRRQMELIGISYDWSRSFYSSDPHYYRWTQWIFTKLYEKGLAYRSHAYVNWDPIDKTVLANEEIIGGRAERSGALVEKKLIPQWYFKITDYAQRLIDDLEELDWPEGIKNQQRNWIGRSEGVEFEMKIAGPGITPGTSKVFDLDSEAPNPAGDISFKVFTTRIDTVFGMTFCVIAPEHPLVDKFSKLSSGKLAESLLEYVTKAKELSDIDRQADGREKSGVASGYFAIHPFTGENIPIFVADYVLMGYGTGAIMAVPGHDQRDFDFASKFNIKIVPVIVTNQGETALVEVEHCLAKGQANESKDGILVNSREYSGMSVTEAQAKLFEWVEMCEIGYRKINYRLRDWLISRQRYWGCPIPMLHSKDEAISAVPVNQLPVTLPDVKSYEPSNDGSSPLSLIDEFVNAAGPDGSLWHRETDTMGGFACSSWYFLRFCDPMNDEAAWDMEKVNYWMPVDCYVGGAEHAVMHLLYARFWTKVLYDLGLVNVKEPFARLMNQGQVLGNTAYRQPREDEILGVAEDGILVSTEEAKTYPAEQLTWRWTRMSKSKGNVVTPDEAVAQYGADALRIYELFVAPFDADVNWSNDGMQGAVRFLSRVMKFANEVDFQADWQFRIEGVTGASKKIRQISHSTLAKVTDGFERFSFNTSIAELMKMLNSIQELKKDLKGTGDESLALSEALEFMILMLAPLAPHTADEIWESLQREGFTYQAVWPVSDPELAQSDTVIIAIQINGKLRDTFQANADASNTTLEETAIQSEKAKGFIEGKTVKKVIVVPGKLVNIVVA